MKILVIFPHPDDAVICAGGTLTRWIEEGHHVTAVCCTPGNVGTLRLDQTAAELAAARTQELEKAHRISGIQSLEILPFPDGGVMDLSSLRRELFRCVRQYQPDRVMTMDPWARYEVHPDHIQVGRMAAEAAAFACFPLLYPEQLTARIRPHNASELWFMGLLGQPPNTFVNIERQLEKKVDALLQFESTFAIIQGLFNNTSDADSARIRENTLEWTRKWSERFGKPAGLKAAEAFIVQRCAPGHLDNMDERFAEILGEPRARPHIIG